MEKIKFIFEGTNEPVIFCILGHTQMNDVAYLLVVDEKEIETDQMTAYILKAIEADHIDVYYDLVDDEKELERVVPRLEKYLEAYQIEQ